MNEKNITAQPVCPVTDLACATYRQYQKLQSEIDVLTEQARTDALTGLFNYRHFNEALQTEIERVNRTVQAMCLVLVDIDHFKQFNDSYGHDVGNQALQHVANILAGEVRRMDVACRFGGEEFAIILPATPLAPSTAVAERMRKAVENNPLMYQDQALRLTISLGVAVHDPLMTTSATELLSSADAKLYESKNKGRNCVSVPEATSIVSEAQVTAEEKGALFSYPDESSDEQK